jgi:aryl-alcohol dehydrogenase-like predicted oxidoreductase
MEYKFLGRTGIKISRFCFGTMSFGGEVDEGTAGRMFRLCRKRGINMFDCADVYNKGQSEEILGRLIRDCREDVIITSKVYFPTADDINACGASRKHIRHACEASLKRLATDYLDVYFVHRFDDTTPLEETLRALDDLVRQGKILHIGASNFTAWQTAKALGLSAAQALSRFECIQPMYNLVKRQAEVEMLPMALSESLGVLPYNPLAGGLLSGKYGLTHMPESGRLVENKIYQARYGEKWMYETAENFASFAKQREFEPAALAIAWVASHPAVTAPIIGARNLDQLESCLRAADIVMSPELRGEISALTPPPQTATDRNEEGSAHSFYIRK